VRKAVELLEHVCNGELLRMRGELINLRTELEAIMVRGRRKVSFLA
jgi:hypothetical protein